MSDGISPSSWLEVKSNSVMSSSNPSSMGIEPPMELLERLSLAKPVNKANSEGSIPTSSLLSANTGAMNGGYKVRGMPLREKTM